MLKFACVLAFCLTAAVGLPSEQRIKGGSLTTIDQYPFGAVILMRSSPSYRQECGGTIINNRSILTAAHCLLFISPGIYAIRVGSSFAHSGGTVYYISQYINHPNYDRNTLNNDISILRTSSGISFGPNVQPGRIAGSNYNVADDSVVWVIGWGIMSVSGPSSEQLRHVQIWTINQNICRERDGRVTDNMLCAGYLDVGGRSACFGDSGGPLLHNGVVVGVVNFGASCTNPRFPGVYARVSRFTNWIISNQ